jgi:hypothetical protein
MQPPVMAVQSSRKVFCEGGFCNNQQQTQADTEGQTSDYLPCA